MPEVRRCRTLQDAEVRRRRKLQDAGGLKDLLKLQDREGHDFSRAVMSRNTGGFSR